MIVSGSAPSRCSTIVCGWWKRGTTSIQPSVPSTRAAPGSGLRSEVSSVAERPSAYPSSSAASASTPLGNREPAAWTVSGSPSSICAKDTT